MSGENIEEVYENREQIEVSRMYERMPKPSAIAVEEMLEGRIVFRHTEVPAATAE